MELGNTTINYGGMFRCCVQSFNNYVGSTPHTEKVAVGETVVCEHCFSKIKLDRHGVWRWSGEEQT